MLDVDAVVLGRAVVDRAEYGTHWQRGHPLASCRIRGYASGLQLHAWYDGQVLDTGDAVVVVVVVVGRVYEAGRQS